MIDKMVRHIVGTGKEHKRLRLFAPPARRKQRAAAMALSVCMVFTAMPQTAFAAEAQNGLCEHHLYHTVKCGYTEAAEGHPCEHEHTGDCFTDMLICGYIENEDATASDSNTGHTHTQDCHALDCPHENGEHDKACHYKEAVEGRPCGNVCELCGGPVNNGNSGGGIETVTLVAFGGLEEAVVHQSVPAGTLLEELVLPETLSATAQAGDESPEQVTVPNVTWEPDALYEGAAGSYDFTASAVGYTCAQGVDWPVITVTVEETTPVPDEIDALCAAIDNLPTVEALYDNAPGDGAPEFEAWVTETRAMLKSIPALWEQFLALSEDASAMERITDARKEKLAGLNSLAERLGEAKPLANTGATGGTIASSTEVSAIQDYFGGAAKATVTVNSGKGTITLQTDVTLDATVTFNDTDRAWTLDLNGHTLAGAQPVGADSFADARGIIPVTLTGGRLEVISTAGGGTLRGGDGDGTYTNSDNGTGGFGGDGLLMRSTGVLTLTDNKVTLQGGDGQAGDSAGGNGLWAAAGTVTLAGVICQGGNGHGNSNDGIGVYLLSDVTVDGAINCTAQGGTGAAGLLCQTAAAISDGSYTGDAAGVRIVSGQKEVTVTGGTFTSGQYGLYVENGSGNVHLSGGTFTGDGGSAYAVYNLNSGETVEDLLAENYAYFNGSDQITTGLTEAKLGQNTTITVKSATTTITGGTIASGTEVSAIQDYFGGADKATVTVDNGKGTITLQTDVTLDATVDFNDTVRDWILDLNGHTLAGAQPVDADSLATAMGVTPVTLTGGKLAVISAVEGGRLRGGDGDGTYTVSNNGGSGGDGLTLRGTGVLTLTDSRVTIQGGDGKAGNSLGGDGLYARAGTVTLTDVICQGGNGTGNSNGGYGVILSSDVTVAGEIKCTAQGGTNAAGLNCQTAAAISDGSYTGGVAGAQIDSGQKNVIVTGGTFTGGSYGLGVFSGNVQFSGGTFTGDGGGAYAVYNQNSGGTAADLLAENYAYFDGSDQITTGLTEAKLGLNTTLTVKSTTTTATGGTIESSTEVSAIQDYFGGADKATVMVNNGKGTITLQTDVTLDATVEFNDTVRDWTLDLNGHTLAGAQPVDADSLVTAKGITPVTLTGGKLAVTSTVKGGELRGGDGDGTYTNSNWGGLGGDGLLMSVTGVLTLTDSKVTLRGGDGGAGKSRGGGGLNANAGTVTLTGVICQGGNGHGKSDGGNGVYLASNVTVNDAINCTAQGGTDAAGLYCETAAAISDGSYTGGMCGARIAPGQKKVTVTGGTFTSGKNGLYVTNGSGNVKLSGGTFTGNGGSAYAVYNANSGETVADLLAKNYAYFDGSDQITTGLTEAGLGQNTTITVKSATTTTGGTIESSTEVNAIQGYFGGEDKATVSVNDGKGTITLQTDVTLDATVEFNDTARDWTLDLNGHTLAGAQPVDAVSRKTATGITPVTLTGGKLAVISAAGSGTLRGGDGDGTYTSDSGNGGPGGSGLLIRSTRVLTLTDNKVTLQGGNGGAGNSLGGAGLYANAGTVTLTGVICQGGNGTGNSSGGAGVYFTPYVTVNGEIKCTAQGGDGAAGLYCQTAATISDGSYTGGIAGAQITIGTDQKKVTVTGGTFTGGEYGLYVMDSDVQLSGGTFTGDGGSAYAVYNGNGGGTAANLLAENYAYFNGSAQITTGLTKAKLGKNATITVKSATTTATGGTIASSTEVSAIQGYFGGEDKATVSVADGKGTIKLQTNVTLDATVIFSDTARVWTLDLNGYTLAGAQPVGAVSTETATGITPVTLTGGRLAVTSTAGSGTLRGSDGDGTYTDSDNWGGTGGYGLRMPIGSTGVLTLKDNKVTLQGGAGKAGNSSGGTGLYAIDGTVTLTDVICQGGKGIGNIGDGDGVFLSPTVTVDGAINCTAQGGTGAFGLFCYTAATISDGSYTGGMEGARIDSGQKKVIVTGGTFTGGNYGFYVNSGNVQLSGGVFTPGGSGASAIYIVGHGSTDLLAEGYGFFNHGTGEKVTWDNNTGMSPKGVTLEVHSTAPTHTITASAGTGGTISPSGKVAVKEGESQKFIITPNSNYRISQVMADGEDQGAEEVYTFENVTADHRISATFRYIGGSSGGSSGGSGGSSSGGGSSSAPSTTTSTTAGENGTSTTTTQTTSKDSSGKTTTVTTEITKDAAGNTTGSATTVTTDNITAQAAGGSSTVTVKPDAAAIGGAVEAAGASETNPMDVSVTVPQDTVKNELQKADVSAVRVEVVIPKAVEDNPAVRTAGVTVEKETVDAARQTGKNVTVTVREDTGAVKAVWSLDGRAMGNTAGQSTDLKLAVHTAPVQSGDPIAAPVKPPVTAAGQENGLVISLTMDGTLLSAAGLTVPATNQTAITAGSTVALYRFDPNTGTLRAVPGGVYSVDANGNVTIDIPAGTRTGEKETYVLLPVAATAQPAAQPGDSDVHTVKAGDTLNKISRQYGCRVEDLLALNPGLDIYNLRIGSDLRVR